MEFFDFFVKVLFFTVFVLRMSDLKNMKKAKKSLKFCQFWPILARVGNIRINIRFLLEFFLLELVLIRCKMCH
jgi:hypothetical protein